MGPAAKPARVAGLLPLAISNISYAKGPTWKALPCNVHHNTKDELTIVDFTHPPPLPLDGG